MATAGNVPLLGFKVGKKPYFVAMLGFGIVPTIPPPAGMALRGRAQTTPMGARGRVLTAAMPLSGRGQSGTMPVAGRAKTRRDGANE